MSVIAVGLVALLLVAALVVVRIGGAVADRARAQTAADAAALACAAAGDAAAAAAASANGGVLMRLAHVPADDAVRCEVVVRLGLADAEAAATASRSARRIVVP